MGTETPDKGEFSAQGAERGLPGGNVSESAQPLRLLDVEISAARSRYQALEEQIAEKERANNTLQDDIEAREARIEQLESALAAAIAAQAPSADATGPGEGEGRGFHPGARLVKPSEFLNKHQPHLVAAASDAKAGEHAPDLVGDQMNAACAERGAGPAPDNQAIASSAKALTSEQAIERALQNLDRYLLGSSPEQPASVGGASELAGVLSDLERQLKQQRELVRIHEHERAKLGLKHVELEEICVDRQERIAALERQLESREAALEALKSGSIKAADIFSDGSADNGRSRQELASREALADERATAVAAPKTALERDGSLSTGLKPQSAFGSSGSTPEVPIAKTAATAAPEQQSELSQMRARAGFAERDLADAMAEVDRLTRELEKALARDPRSYQSAVAPDVDRQVLVTELREQQTLVAALEGNAVKQQQNMAALQDSWRRLKEITRNDADSYQEAVTEGANQSPSRAKRGVSSHSPYLLVEGSRVALKEPEMTIGRSASNDISLQSLLASRLHARLVFGPGNVLIEDLGSRNGVLVNGKKIRRVRLQHGDEIRIGDCDLRFIEPVPPGQAAAC